MAPRSSQAAPLAEAQQGVIPFSARGRVHGSGRGCTDTGPARTRQSGNEVVDNPAIVNVDQQGRPSYRSGHSKLDAGLRDSHSKRSKYSLPPSCTAESQLQWQGSYLSQRRDHNVSFRQRGGLPEISVAPGTQDGAERMAEIGSLEPSPMATCSTAQKVHRTGRKYCSSFPAANGWIRATRWCLEEHSLGCGLFLQPAAAARVVAIVQWKRTQGRLKKKAYFVRSSRLSSLPLRLQICRRCAREAHVICCRLHAAFRVWKRFCSNSIELEFWED